MERLVAGARRAGPYVLVELLLPGGSLVALGMFAWANRKRLAARFNDFRNCHSRVTSASNSVA
jgi:hypothetical protein